MNIVLAILIGYILGALPLAARVSRRRGIDIFSVGTGLAGASNVRKEAGSLPAGLVLLGDLAKGSLTVWCARILGVEGAWILIPVAGALLGHSKSVFAKFRGGDGFATLAGACIGLFSYLGFLSILLGMLVQLGAQRMSYSSLFGVIFSYAVLVALNIVFEGDLNLVLGLGGLYSLALAHAIHGHRRRRNDIGWEVDQKNGLDMGDHVD